jgi:hypothetical protein
MSKIAYYKLIKSYPNSPTIGKIVRSDDYNYSEFKCSLFKEFWERVYSDKELISKEGETLKLYDDVYLILDRNIVKWRLSYDLIDSSNEFYKFKSSAEIALNSMIKVHCEDGTVEGVNTSLYGVLTKSNWMTSESTSLELWRRGVRSDSWKFFIDEKSRREFIIKNKPLLSLQEIEKLNFNSDLIRKLCESKYYKNYETKSES